MTSIATTATTAFSGTAPAMSPSPSSRRTTPPIADVYVGERTPNPQQHNTNRVSLHNNRFNELHATQAYPGVNHLTVTCDHIPRLMVTLATGLPTTAQGIIQQPPLPSAQTSIRQSSSQGHLTSVNCSTRLFFPAGGIQSHNPSKSQIQHGVKDPSQRFTPPPPPLMISSDAQPNLQQFRNNHEGVHGEALPPPSYETVPGPSYVPFSGGTGSGESFHITQGRSNEETSQRVRTWPLVADVRSQAPFPHDINIRERVRVGAGEKVKVGGGERAQSIEVSNYGLLKRPKEEPPDPDLIILPPRFPTPTEGRPIRPDMIAIHTGMRSVSPRQTKISTHMTALRLEMPPQGQDINASYGGTPTHANNFHQSSERFFHTTTTTFSPMFTVTHPYAGNFTPLTRPMPSTSNAPEPQHVTNPAALGSTPPMVNINNMHVRGDEVVEVGEEEEDWTGGRGEEELREEEAGASGGEGGVRRRRAKRTYVYNPKPITRRSNNPHLNKQMGKVDEAYRKRREYNNEAARRSRNNRRAQEIQTLEQTRRLSEENQRLLGQIDELRKQNSALEERNKELEKEKNRLRDILHRHNVSPSGD